MIARHVENGRDRVWKPEAKGGRNRHSPAWRFFCAHSTPLAFSLGRSVREALRLPVRLLPGLPTRTPPPFCVWKHKTADSSQQKEKPHVFTRQQHHPNSISRPSPILPTNTTRQPTEAYYPASGEE